MNKAIGVALLIFTSIPATYAQKYMTRTGKVTFFSNAALEKIEAINNEAASILDSKTGDVVFQLPVKSFKFEKQLMEEHFNENYMESDKFPKSDFKGKINNINEVNFSKDGAYNVTATGKLSMHGVSRDITVPGSIAIKGTTAVLNSKFMVKPEDYGIKIPAVVAQKVAKEMEVTVNCELGAK